MVSLSSSLHFQDWSVYISLFSSFLAKEGYEKYSKNEPVYELT